MVDLSEILKEADFIYQPRAHKVRPMATSNPVSSLQGIRRRVVYVTLYELIAIGVATFGLAALTGQNASHAGVASVAASVIAVLWNIGFNWAFERWESRQAVRGAASSAALRTPLVLKAGWCSRWCRCLHGGST